MMAVLDNVRVRMQVEHSFFLLILLLLQFQTVEACDYICLSDGESA